MSLPQVISRLLIFIPVLSLFLVLTARVATSAPLQSASLNHRTITASSWDLAFGQIQLGNSVTQFETLTNSDSATVTISQAAVAGTGFGVRGLTLPVSLSKGQSITFRVLCTPGSSGLMTGTISVLSNASNPKLAIALSATGVPAGQLTSSAGAMNFGSVAVGTSKTLVATLTATGSDVTISSATSTSAEFQLSGLSLPRTRRWSRLWSDRARLPHHTSSVFAGVPVPPR